MAVPVALCNYNRVQDGISRLAVQDKDIMQSTSRSGLGYRRPIGMQILAGGLMARCRTVTGHIISLEQESNVYKYSPANVVFRCLIGVWNSAGAKRDNRQKRHKRTQQDMSPFGQWHVCCARVYLVSPTTRGGSGPLGLGWTSLIALYGAIYAPR
jgi:hypothetical protein